MYYKQLKKIGLLLIMGGSIGTVSAQVQAVLKVGDNPYTINDKAALDVESTTKGFLPPRMTKAQRDAIVTPPVGLQVWCSDCNTSIEPTSGELCVYLGSGWAPFTMLTTSRLTTGKKSEANKPVRNSATSATINGVLVSTSGAPPTETGVVWREIIGTDFESLPVLDATGTATVPTYKTAGTLVTAEGSAIAVTIPTLTSTASSTRPYYFRTYAKSSMGIGYGNPVIFNCAPPSFTTAASPNPTSLLPTFTGTLIVNAGTPQNTVTEYGYCSGTTNPPTIANNKVILSDGTNITDLNSALNSEVFTNDVTRSLPVNNYEVPTTATTYFRYYVTTIDGTFYSNVVTLNPTVDPITGGTAIATIASIDPISAQLKIGTASSSNIKVNFTVTKAGTYAAFVPGAASGATTGLSMPQTAAGTFSLGAQSITFAVTGTPATSIVGNSFTVPRIGSLSTGAIQPANIVGGNAECDGVHVTTVVPVLSSTGKTWMDRNLGASRAATSFDDFQAYGCLYQWGRGNDGHASITWTSAAGGTAVNSTTATLSATDTPVNALFITSGTAPYDWRSGQNNALWQGLAGTNNPCPAGYRLPTDTELTSELTAYSITNSATAYASPLKFVVSGNRNDSTGVLSTAGAYGYYWSSTVSSANASFRLFDSGSTASYTSYRATGFSSRCIKD